MNRTNDFGEMLDRINGRLKSDVKDQLRRETKWLPGLKTTINVVEHCHAGSIYGDFVNKRLSCIYMHSDVLNTSLNQPVVNQS